MIYCRDYMVEREVETKNLEIVLSGFVAPPQPVVAMYPENRHLASKVRAFIDFVVEMFASSEVP
ncbi:LysR substrate-binding domain-containing protein [Variovorax robiniae]|uniref:LysR substrate-binding domain-containing protein n=1 Tax=Variovorax robiniae TaxID=1836199 RepID=A0ABU8XN20_9BURK